MSQEIEGLLVEDSISCLGSKKNKSFITPICICLSSSPISFLYFFLLSSIQSPSDPQSYAFRNEAIKGEKRHLTSYLKGGILFYMSSDSVNQRRTEVIRITPYYGGKGSHAACS